MNATSFVRCFISSNLTLVFNLTFLDLTTFKLLLRK